MRELVREGRVERTGSASAARPPGRGEGWLSVQRRCGAARCSRERSRCTATASASCTRRHRGEHLPPAARGRARARQRSGEGGGGQLPGPLRGAHRRAGRPPARGPVVGTYVERGAQRRWSGPNDPSMPAPCACPGHRSPATATWSRCAWASARTCWPPGGAVRRGGRLAGAPGESFAGGAGHRLLPGLLRRVPARGDGRGGPRPAVTSPRRRLRDEGRRDLARAAAGHHRRRGRARLRRRGLRRGPTAGGWRLVVAIADVTHYVREGTALDARGAPPRHLRVPARTACCRCCRSGSRTASARCKPDEDRLCMVADMVFDRAGERDSPRALPGGDAQRGALHVRRGAATCSTARTCPHRNALHAAVRAAAARSARALTADAHAARRHRLRPARDARSCSTSDGSRCAWSGASARTATASSRSACSPPTRRWRVLPGARAALGVPVPRRAGRGEARRVRRAGAGPRLQAASAGGRAHLEAS